ncbi:MAG: hypothetical protein K9J37_14065 [Saprospiraceae bacterium]|nr:hypothetical protein [Saprospiraceae bacterium]MCF8251031.1 hypothetical protein [Saprospiraceae bacterium]MCF8281487.1 hypothetical protein [Bacteroidales bacterium]MCF8311628.1 hypothetical protein [Saprospiraceae bacterium]MCF8440969.1 hypothetical protein [Saprospiraceae bacterium]
MNSENFHEYVKNPSMLHQVTYQELKSLVLQYPYSPNLRYLLLLKSLFEQSRDFDRNQVLASLSSPDRKKLRQLVKQYTRFREMQENYTLNEDFLELKDLSSLESMMDEMEADAAPKQTGAAVPPPLNPTKVEAIGDDLEEEVEEVSDLNFLMDVGGIAEADENATTEPVEPNPEVDEIAATESHDQSVPLEELMETAEDEMQVEEASVEEAIPDIAVEETPEEAETPKPTAANIPLEITSETDAHPTPMPKSSFNTWLRKFKPPEAGILSTDLKDISLNNKPHQHPVEEIEPDAKQIAEQSVVEDGEIASETFALLLERQRLFGKAISMYEQLKLLYPEKSSLFAAKIEELNKKI